MELYRLSENCEYGDTTDNMIRDRLVVGIRDTSLSQQLQIDSELTLEKAKQRIRQREAVSEQQRELKGATLEATDLEELHSRSRKGFRGRRYTKPSTKATASDSPKTTPSRCRRCGKPSHPRDKCPAKDAVCHRCHKKGHYGSRCLTKHVSEIEPDDSQNKLDTAFLDTVTTKTDSAWFATIEINGRKLNFKLDTGAEVTAISEQEYKKLDQPPLSPAKCALYGPSRQPLQTAGQFTGKLRSKNNTAMQQVFVVKCLKTNLLGLPAITALKLAVRVDSTTLDTDWRKDFPSVFQGLGNLGDKYEIHLNTGAIPYSLFTPRHVPIPLCPKVQDELKRMESLGVIRKVDEPTPWCAGMVVVPKKEGAIRICIDLKPLNENVLREVHPLPRVDDTLAQLSGAKVFSKLDANSGFWQIPLAKKSQLLTTFITPFGRYYFIKMPFGISSAPEHFQKRMSQVLSGLSGVLCLMDDVLVFGRDKQEHNLRLTAVLKRIQEAGVTLNASKCEFEKTQLKFLGHVVDKDGIRADPDKTSAIENMKPPTTVPELRRFMGMVNQLGKFSPHLADITQPLRQLLSKKTAWLWGPAQEKAFMDIKRELTKPTVLALYNPLAPTKVCADAWSRTDATE